MLRGACDGHGGGYEALNLRMSDISSVLPSKEIPMKLTDKSIIEFPGQNNSVQADWARPSYRRNWQRSSSKFSGKKLLGGILIVDDDPNVRRLLRIILETSGYDVLEAEDGDAASHMLCSREISMMVNTIITTLALPNIDGLDAITYFQKEFPSIPVIILIRVSEVDEAISYMNRGVSHYLVKPIDPKKLVAAVATVFTQRKQICG